ncbi:hypothetical protein KVR01_007602 [Diaporthe batatas]|uniref:uncharacterized protein n=1 Tax=Diaporthe batatas TaxID=748121 RepID=UPI001D04FF1E|nr:uncharacterized protein KVR01_007602 [Diaporthe batatas]KAG8163124.1 hypothetical protein KVR01_007602 [Diaporthe batatas]
MPRPVRRTEDGPHPKLLSSFRRFGRADSFKPVGASSTSIGSKSLGKVNIDCQFLFKESQWGTFEGRPGGIVYLNLNFGPPQNCRVQEATVTITLDEEDPCLEPFNTTQRLSVLHESGIEAQMTPWFGPQVLGGEKKFAEVTSTTKAIPEATVIGNGGGGIGHERSKVFRQEARWSFYGQLLRKKRTATYASLRWHLNENELEGQAFHNPTFRTAFAFEHCGRPFLIKVDIEGRLEKWHHQVQSKLKFGAGGAREGKVVTLVDFEDYRRFSRDLEAIARGLPRTMEMRNLEEIPMEIQDSVPGATFYQASPAPWSSSGPSEMLQTTAQHPGQQQQQTYTSNSEISNQFEEQPLLQERGQSLSTPREVSEIEQGDGEISAAENYRRLLSAFSDPGVQEGVRENAIDTTSSDASTLMNSENSMDSANETPGSRDCDTQKTETEQSRSGFMQAVTAADQDTMLAILGIPGMLAFLQFLASIMSFLGTVPSNKRLTEE